MKKFLFWLGICGFAFTAKAELQYVVEKSVNDEIFVINDSVFRAQTFCFNVLEGDLVIFTEGNAFGACDIAEFVNLRTGDVCQVWCE